MGTVCTSSLTRQFAQWLGSGQGTPGLACLSSRASSFAECSHRTPSKPQCPHLPSGIHGVLRELKATVTVVISPALEPVLSWVTPWLHHILTGCVILEKLLNLSVPQSFTCKTGIMIIIPSDRIIYGISQRIPGFRCALDVALPVVVGASALIL